MTLETDFPNTAQPLGVGRLLSRSFGAFFASFWRLAAVLVIPMVLASHAVDAIRSFLFATLDGPFWMRPLAPGAFGGFGSLPLTGLLVLLVSLTFALLIWSVAILAVSARTGGQKVALKAYFLVPLRKLPQVLVLSVAVGLVIAASFMIVVMVPFSTGSGIFTLMGYFAWLFVFLYILGTFSPLLSVILVEKTGWRSLTRSLDLTRGYRWPLAGLVMLYLLLVGLLVYLMQLATGLVTVWTLTAGSDFSRARTINDVLETGFTAIVIGYSASLAIVIFNRLLVVKEGHFANIDTVFD